MSDIIRLLPDSVANQIAAGEVVQRPASVVKELLENSVDAGANHIKLILKDAGRTLIQVIDNGCGMTTNDARMCFERHATSKISKADDLFAIKTKGFRGEAMASIAAVAQVELKTCRHEDKLGTLIQIEATSIKKHEPLATAPGTSISVKNLFFNIPARRNFLKSDNVELKHVIDEFQRVALAHPEIHMELTHNNNTLFNLPVSNYRQRIVNIYGKSYNERLVPTEETTDIVSIKGYIVKPEYCKKTRGEQYFFVNNRFIKSPYLHHAIHAAYTGLIQADMHTGYFIYLDVNPSSIDINIHPTKTEVKFEDEKSIYSILFAAVKRSLGLFNVAPSIDFGTPSPIDIPLTKINPEKISVPKIHINENYNPFSKHSNKPNKPKNTSPFPFEELFEITDLTESEKKIASLKNDQSNNQLFDEINHTGNYVYTAGRYLIIKSPKGFSIIDVCRAHERVLYDRFIKSLNTDKAASQQQLFPQAIELNPADFVLLKELETELQSIGFSISFLGNYTISINGIPTGIAEDNPAHIIENMLEELKHHSSEIKNNRKHYTAMLLAGIFSIKPGRMLHEDEISALLKDLFHSHSPAVSPKGKNIIVNFGPQEFDKYFN
jgi:DNA mismatch repair protein MutL